MQDILALISGSFVGFSLGLVGGGGSILAVPLLLYVVGVRDPHTAIGTSAFAVAANAVASLVPHARAGHVRWKSAGIFAVTGAAGAILGSTIGKSINGNKLLAFFAMLMIVVAVLMQREREAGSGVSPSRRPEAAWRLPGVGFGAGVLAGFFGIGGGFLIVPGLILATGMPIIAAIGSSLLSVGSFGLATAANYAIAGWVDWRVAVEFLAGGALGGWGGAWVAGSLAGSRTALNRIFGAMLVIVAVYMLYRSLVAAG